MPVQAHVVLKLIVLPPTQVVLAAKPGGPHDRDVGGVARVPRAKVFFDVEHPLPVALVVFLATQHAINLDLVRVSVRVTVRLRVVTVRVRARIAG